MMASLRARLLVAVLALTAGGMLLVGGITYAEQRSFLYDRVDQQVTAAIPPVAGKLDQLRGGPGGGYDDRDDHGPGGGPNLGIPAGTYGQKRDADGNVLAGTGKVFTPLNQAVTAKPELPAELPVGRIITVDGAEGAGTRYRVLAQRDPMGSTITVAAIPLGATDDTLRRLLVVEALVIAAILIVLGLVS